MWFSLLTVLFIASSVILVLVILVQRPQGGGLAQAFGGASGGGTDTAFGGRTGDVLTYLTMGAFALYLLVAIGLNVIDNQVGVPEAATEAEVIEPGLLPPVNADGTPAAPVTPAGVPAADQPLVAPSAPAGVPAVDQPLTAAPPASAPSADPTPAPATDPVPSGGNP